jgi:hypothetical protein
MMFVWRETVTGDAPSGEEKADEGLCRCFLKARDLRKQLMPEALNFLSFKNQSA